MLLLFLFSCSPEETLVQNYQNPLILNAKNWTQTNKSSFKILEYIKSIEWDKAIITSNSNNQLIEVPLLLKENLKVKYGENDSYKTYNRLVFISDKDGNLKVYHMLITTKSIFENDNKENNFNTLTNNFNGIITFLDSDNQVVNQIPSLKKSKSSISNKTAYEDVTCTYLVEMYDDGSVRPIALLFCTGGGYSNGGGTVSGGGSGGGKGDAPLEAPIILLGPYVVITNINDYLKCFNLSQAARLVIYVDQPIPNSIDAWSGTIINPNVGHTFIAIQQGSIRRVFGYYPETTVTPSLSPSDPAVFGNDQSHIFDVSLAVNISPNQLLNIIGYCNNAPSTYNLNNYNCSDFAIAIGNLGGLNLPDSYGTWNGGGGSNPGQLGQNIRTMSLPANVNAVRQITTANSASNTGICN